MLHQNNIQDTTTTVENPQANAICKRMHQTMSNMLCMLLHTYQPHNQQQFNNMVDIALASSMYAIRAAIHTGLQATPVSLAFHRDMILNIPFEANI